MVRRLQARVLPVLLASLKAGGVGLNLPAADTVIHVEPWWNPTVQAQDSARAHRLGQDQPVFVHHLMAQGSIEERMLKLQARKRALEARVAGQDGVRGLVQVWRAGGGGAVGAAGGGRGGGGLSPGCRA